jgi:hypothetical protein
MNRLPLELDRLYGLAPLPADGESAPARPGRALVLELALPGHWEQLAAAWKGVQSELALPAPAIAVSGSDGLQLWFALAAPVSPEAGARFLDDVRARYLPEIDPRRVRLFTDVTALPATPPAEVRPEQWCAFVAPDLAALFAETPWLDIPPSDDGQAALLHALETVSPTAFSAASRQLRTIEHAPHDIAIAAPPAPRPGEADPERFLERVMDDETAPLALRVDAAKALLRHRGHRPDG